MSKFRKSGGFDERYKGGKESNQAAGFIGAIIAFFVIIKNIKSFLIENFSIFFPNIRIYPNIFFIPVS